MNKFSSLLLILACVFCLDLVGEESDFSIREKGASSSGDSIVRISVFDSETKESIPFRAIVKGESGSFYDGSGRNVYDDGRFFADGNCEVKVDPGSCEFTVSRGPEYLPAEFTVRIPLGKIVEVDVSLFRWISLAELGWYGGDNHVHSKHDSHTPIKTDLAYAALQGRAGGLNFVTEAGSNVDYSEIEKLNRDDFQIRYCGEIRPGPFVGHFNPAGLDAPIPDDLYQKLINHPLPASGVYREIRKLGGVVTHTHPMMPRHQLHWMGATQAWSDAVRLDMADLFDVDGNHTERLWFALLNLGNRIAVSGHTDAALGRTRTPSPGDQRIYCRADGIDYDGFVASMRNGRTMATNGGPIFTFFTADGVGPGEVVKGKGRISARLEIEALHELGSAAIYQNGVRVAAFNVSGKKGPVEFEKEIEIPQDRPSWLVARAQDKKGKWCLTSPIYFEPEKEVEPAPASAVLFQICNATRFADLSPDFFGHIIATVREPEIIESVKLLRDDKVVKTYRRNEKNQLPEDGKIPVTGMWGQYDEGHIWHPDTASARHFQADVEVEETGWYRISVETDLGSNIESSAMYFDAGNHLSHSLSAATLRGHETELVLWGYGADIEIEKLHPKLNKGSWWYPKDIFWRVKSRFGSEEQKLGWPPEQPVERFRE